MEVQNIWYTIDQNLQILGSFVFSNFQPKELALQWDRCVNKYMDSMLTPAQVGTLQGVDEIQADIDNLRFLKVIDLNIPLTNGEGDLPADYRNLLNDRSVVTYCGASKVVANRLTGDEDLYRILENPFTKTKILSPISRIYGNKIRIYTDNFVVPSVNIDYIRKPTSLFDLGAIEGYESTNFNTYDLQDFPEQTLQVIMDNMRDRLLELVQAERLSTAVQESQDFGKNKT